MEGCTVKEKMCKYCKKPGQFDLTARKVLCLNHRVYERNWKEIWEVNAVLQLEKAEE